jgi:hypothetical protein
MDNAFRAGGGLAWVGLYRPTEQEFAAVAAEFGLHELAIEDAVHPHQRPTLERRYGETLFCVLRPTRYVDESEAVEVQRDPRQIVGRDGGQGIAFLGEGSCGSSSIRGARHRALGKLDAGPDVHVDDDGDDLEHSSGVKCSASASRKR